MIKEEFKETVKELGKTLDIQTDEDLSSAKTYFLDYLSKRCPYKENFINEEISQEEVIINVSDVFPSNYRDLMTKISGKKSYLEEQEILIKSYMEDYDFILGLLGSAISNMTAGKNAEERAGKQKIKLLELYAEKNEIERLYRAVQGRVKRLQSDYDAVSRLIAFWEYDFKAHGTRYVDVEKTF